MLYPDQVLETKDDLDVILTITSSRGSLIAHIPCHPSEGELYNQCRCRWNSQKLAVNAHMVLDGATTTHQTASHLAEFQNEHPSHHICAPVSGQDEPQELSVFMSPLTEN
jgi:hypothetical protein